MEIRLRVGRDQGTIPVKVSSGTVDAGVRLEHQVMEIQHNAYEGEYTVTPAVNAQVLDTENKVMARDVTIEAIPFYEVSNPQGGTTINIGGD